MEHNLHGTLIIQGTVSRIIGTVLFSEFQIKKMIPVKWTEVTLQECISIVTKHKSIRKRRGCDSTQCVAV